MRVLFDHGVPAPLRRRLAGHSIDTAAERGWETLSNGDLLDRAEAEGYEAFVTTDQSMRHQQNLADRPFGTVAIMATDWPRVRHRAEAIRDALDDVGPGEVAEVAI